MEKQLFFNLLDEYGCTYREEDWCGLYVKFPCICPNGSEWNPTPRDVIGKKMNRCGCKLCGFRNGASSGEIITAYLFRKYDIEYTEEKTFCDLVSEKGSNLRFDFMVGNTLLELHGNQHFKNKKSGFGANIENDQKKERYAIDNGYGYLVLATEKDWYGWVYRTDFPLIQKINSFLKENGYLERDIEFTKEDKQKCMEIAFKGRLKYKVYDIWTEELVFETNLYTDVCGESCGINLRLASELNRDKPFKSNEQRIVINEDYFKKEDIDFLSLREMIESKRKQKEGRRTIYKIKILNNDTIFEFTKLVEIENEFGYHRLTDCVQGKSGKLFPKEIEWFEVNNERIYHFLDSNRSYIVFTNGKVIPFDSRLELEKYLGYAEGKGNQWVKEGFPSQLDSQIEFLHLKGKRAYRKKYKYSFTLKNGEKFETNNKKEVGNFFGTGIGWVAYYNRKKELPKRISEEILNFELTM